MKKSISFLLVFVILISVLTGCGEKEASKTEISKETVKIGFIGPLTGDSQPWGEAQLNEIKLCVENINKNGGILGREVKLFYYDNRADNVESANATKRLIQKDGVCAVIGPNSSGPAIAMGSVCDEYMVPMLATNATNPQVTKNDKGEVRPYVFRICLNDNQYGEIIANYAYDKMGIRNAAIFYEIGSDYSQGIKQTFEAEYKKLGGNITAVEAYKTGDVDYRAQMSKIKMTDPEAIFLPADYKQIALAANQARDLGEDAIFLGTDSWFSSDILTLAGKSVEGAVFTTALDVENPGLKDIKEEYLKTYGEEIDIMGTTGYFGYDAFQVLKSAIEKAGTDDSKAVRDALEQTTGVKGCVGTININPETHDTLREISIMTIEDSKFKTITPYTLGE